MFYDDSILSGTKTHQGGVPSALCFMMTQFFQVLKRTACNIPYTDSFMMTQFFQVLKPVGLVVV